MATYTEVCHSMGLYLCCMQKLHVGGLGVPLGGCQEAIAQLAQII